MGRPSRMASTRHFTFPSHVCPCRLLHGNKHLNIELPAGGGWSRDVPCWAHLTWEFRVSSPGTCLEHGCGLACPGFPSMHSKLALVSTRPSNLLASNNTLFLACHARHAMPSRPFHAHIHSMQGDEPKEPSKPHTAPPPGGGFEGLEPREWLPGLEDFENHLERKKKLPIPDADQSAEPAGVSRVYPLHYTRTTFGPVRAFSMHCNVRHFSRRQDKPPPSPESRSGFGVILHWHLHTLVRGDGRWYCRNTSTCYYGYCLQA